MSTIRKKSTTRCLNQNQTKDGSNKAQRDHQQNRKIIGNPRQSQNMLGNKGKNHGRDNRVQHIRPVGQIAQRRKAFDRGWNCTAHIRRDSKNGYAVYKKNKNIIR